MKRYFQFDELGTNYKTEFIAGLTTFYLWRMCYLSILLRCHLEMLRVTGRHRNGSGCSIRCYSISSSDRFVNYGYFRKVSDCFSAGMGINAFFAYTAVLTMGIPWQTAIAGTLMSGIIFIILTASGIREKSLMQFHQS